jgi:hypothetical protein
MEVCKRSYPDGGAVEAVDEKCISMGGTNSVGDRRRYAVESSVRGG